MFNSLMCYLMLFNISSLISNAYTSTLLKKLLQKYLIVQRARKSTGYDYFGRVMKPYHNIRRHATRSTWLLSFLCLVCSTCNDITQVSSFNTIKSCPHFYLASLHRPSANNCQVDLSRSKSLIILSLYFIVGVNNEI